MTGSVLPRAVPDTADPDPDGPDPDALDLLDPATYAYGDPDALWTRLRRNRPVYWSTGGDGPPFWVVTRHADVRAVLRDNSRFSSRRGTMLSILHARLPDIATDQMMPDSDPPLHTWLRTPVAQSLTHDVLAAQRPRLVGIVRELLAPVLAGETVDLAAAAMMFPMAFTGALMGIPEEDWPLMARLTTMTVAYSDPEYAAGSPRATLAQAHHELFACFAAEVERRTGRLPPPDRPRDLIDVLLTMTVEDRRLPPEQVLLNAYSLLLGANVTTPHATSVTTLALARHPEQWQRLRADPSLVASCVEEGLRWASPAMHFLRHATVDTVLGGELIRAGEPVSAWIASANRDERVFPEPFRFDVARQPNKHLSFGFGPHYCIGSGIARLALQVYLEELVRSADRIEVTGPAVPLESNFVRGLKHLPVRLGPRR